jgi:hypothetical protein
MPDKSNRAALIGSIAIFPVTITKRKHPVPFRTRKLSSSVPMILLWQRSGKVGRHRVFFLFPEKYCIPMKKNKKIP